MLTRDAADAEQEARARETAAGHERRWSVGAVAAWRRRSWRRRRSGWGCTHDACVGLAGCKAAGLAVPVRHPDGICVAVLVETVRPAVTGQIICDHPRGGHVSAIHWRRRRGHGIERAAFIAPRHAIVKAALLAYISLPPARVAAVRPQAVGEGLAGKIPGGHPWRRVVSADGRRWRGRQRRVRARVARVAGAGGITRLLAVSPRGPHLVAVAIPADAPVPLGARDVALRHPRGRFVGASGRGVRRRG